METRNKDSIWRPYGDSSILVIGGLMIIMSMASFRSPYGVTSPPCPVLDGGLKSLSFHRRGADDRNPVQGVRSIFFSIHRPECFMPQNSVWSSYRKDVASVPPVGHRSLMIEGGARQGAYKAAGSPCRAALAGYRQGGPVGPHKAHASTVRPCLMLSDGRAVFRTIRSNG